MSPAAATAASCRKAMLDISIGTLDIGYLASAGGAMLPPTMYEGGDATVCWRSLRIELSGKAVGLGRHRKVGSRHLPSIHSRVRRFGHSLPYNPHSTPLFPSQEHRTSCSSPPAPECNTMCWCALGSFTRGPHEVDTMVQQPSRSPWEALGWSRVRTTWTLTRKSSPQALLIRRSHQIRPTCSCWRHRFVSESMGTSTGDPHRYLTHDKYVTRVRRGSRPEFPEPAPDLGFGRNSTPPTPLNSAEPTLGVKWCRWRRRSSTSEPCGAQDRSGALEDRKAAPARTRARRPNPSAGHTTTTGNTAGAAEARRNAMSAQTAQRNCRSHPPVACHPRRRWARSMSLGMRMTLLPWMAHNLVAPIPAVLWAAHPC